MILYINYQHCTSVKQLKGYFAEDLTPESITYADLLDYGRHGEIAKWLREMGEPELASKVETISPDLRDSVFFARLKSAITGILVPDDKIDLRPTFDKCFALEGVKCDIRNNEAQVSVSLKVLMCVNESYELSVSSNWGMRGMIINPHSYTEGKTAFFVFTFRKRPGKDVGEVSVKADGRVLADKKVLSTSIDNNSEIRVGNVKFKMIHIEGGTFTMGGHKQDRAAYENEKPTHQVTLDSYSIGETPVTQKLWQAVMGSNPSHFKGALLPVEGVSWKECQEFIRKLNQKTDKNFRLPTEAEWEFAAHGGMKSKGFKYSGSNQINEVAWYSGNSSYRTHPVKEKSPNELGIYDMIGNVWEWCQDCFGSYNRRSQTNPIGPASGSTRVRRGGSWNCGARCCRLSYRGANAPYHSGYDLGLRIALSE